MVELLVEAKQEVPSWLESLAYEARHTGGGSNRRTQNRSRLDILLVLKKFSFNISKLKLKKQDFEKTDLKLKCCNCCNCSQGSINKYECNIECLWIFSGDKTKILIIDVLVNTRM
jgi:hypothetical protein